MVVSSYLWLVLIWSQNARRRSVGLSDHPYLDRNFALGFPSTLNLYGVTGWRAPRFIDVTCLPNEEPTAPPDYCWVSKSELSALPTFDVFRNIAPSNVYWLDGLMPMGSGNFGNFAYFHIAGASTAPYFGHGSTDEGSALLFAWAVHDGDVHPVPEPSIWLMFAVGLIGLRFALGFRERRPT